MAANLTGFKMAPGSTAHANMTNADYEQTQGFNLQRGAGSAMNPPQAEIPSMLDSIDKELELMRDRITTLHDALQSILLPCRPTEGLTSGVEQAVETPIGGRLGDQRAVVRLASASLQNLLNRIAL